LPRAGAVFLLVQLGTQSQDAGGNSGYGGGLIQTPLKFTDLLTAMDADEQNQLSKKRQAILDGSEDLSPLQSN
jgi:hypothetical protein